MKEQETGIGSDMHMHKGLSTLSDTGRRKINAYRKHLFALSAPLKSMAVRKVEQYFKKILQNFSFSESAFVQQYPFANREFGEMPFDKRLLQHIAATFLWRSIQTGTFFARIGEARTILYGINDVVYEKIDSTMHSIYAHHIEMYTLLFQDLDNKRKHNPNQIEVYLGRDAMFMYQARKAQLIARGESTKKIVYINYPRAIQNNLQITHAVRRKYIADRSARATNDFARDVEQGNVEFIDTGYAGSVPEHIMRDVYEQDDDAFIDEHINLIGVAYNTYALRCTESLRYGNGGTAVHAIEHAPKPECPATGLYKNKRTGKIDTCALERGPIHQFKYDMLRHIIMRHFYLQGKYEKETGKYFRLEE